MMTPSWYFGSSSSSNSRPMTSRSPAILPAFLMATAWGVVSRPLMTMGGAVMPRVSAMKGVLVPLPAPGRRRAR